MQNTRESEVFINMCDKRRERELLLNFSNGSFFFFLSLICLRNIVIISYILQKNHIAIIFYYMWNLSRIVYLYRISRIFLLRKSIICITNGRGTYIHQLDSIKFNLYSLVLKWSRYFPHFLSFSTNRKAPCEENEKIPQIPYLPTELKYRVRYSRNLTRKWVRTCETRLVTVCWTLTVTLNHLTSLTRILPNQLMKKTWFCHLILVIIWRKLANLFSINLH